VSLDNPERNPKAPPATATGPSDVDDRFRLFVESVTDYGIFMLDLTGHIASWNAGAQRIKGYQATEVIGKHFSIFYPAEQIAAGKCEHALEIAVSEGRFEEEGYRLRKDGRRFWANVVITAVRDAKGELIGFGKVTRDLTERRDAEQELRRSEERLRLLIASVTDYAIFILDPRGHVATWNPGAQRLKGYRAEEIIGRHFSTFYPEEDVRAGKCERELEGAASIGRFEDEGWRLRKDGTPFWANVVITPIRDGDGVLVGFAKVTRDLSERRRHEEERVGLARAEEARRVAEQNEERMLSLAESLRLARDKAEEGTRLKDEFLATVSHELRTPLNAMLGWARLLQSRAVDKDKAAHAIDTIVRNAMAQAQIIDDLLDVSRIIAGQLRLEVDFVDINAVLRAAVDVVRPAAEAKGIAFSTVHDTTVGLVKGDAGRLQQVLWNLLTNAVKFTPRGGSVQVALRAQGTGVVIEVTDNGQGIAPEFLERVFQRFTQQESSQSRRAGGLGLGLAIVKHLVELHGGTVHAESAGTGKGSTFVVKIPLVSVAPQGAEPVAGPGTETEDVRYPSELNGLKVLVLDDERDSRELVQEVLARGGATVWLASSVPEALTLIGLEPPDVIVSDIGMPEEDGYAFIAKLRALPRESGGRIPAVALTAYARAEDRRKALMAGFQNHAAKPVEPQELVMVVANLAGRYA